MTSTALAPPAPVRTPPGRRRFLPEVQALRALAVTLVVVYHAYPAAAPGGFVGVDVFFVISGFLITSHLLREADATGRVSLPAFWAARVRRIMPAAVVTVLAVVGVTVLWWPMSQWGDISRQAVASLLSVENGVLASDSVDYLAADNAPTALQHFWSLGVEEQFYLAWPLVVIAALAIATRLRRRVDAAGRRPRASVRPLAAVLFAVVLIASLVLSVRLVRHGDPAAYFVTTARVWELAAGGLLAALLPAAGWGARGQVRVIAALAGLAVLIAVAVFYTEKTPFPGQGAIAPVAGTLAIIAAGRTTGVGSLHRITDLRPVQWVGDVSYSLYLWRPRPLTTPPEWRGCVARAYATEVTPCVFGDPQGGLDIVLVGGSHAAQWIEAFDRVGTQRHWRITVYARNSCPFSLVPRTFERARHTNCSATVEATLQAIERSRPDAVVMASWSGNTYVSDPRPGFSAAFARLRAAGITPVVLRDTPWGFAPDGAFIRDCVAAHPSDPQRCDLPRTAAVHVDGAEDAAHAAEAAVVDPTPWFCSATTCPAVIGNVLVWKDQDHITNTYLLTLQSQLGDALSAAIGSGS